LNTCAPFAAASNTEYCRPHALVALDDALDAVAALDPRKAKVIELRPEKGEGLGNVLPCPEPGVVDGDSPRR
jgi:hypothetical protein